jgi:hypothetical protein
MVGRAPGWRIPTGLIFPPGPVIRLSQGQTGQKMTRYWLNSPDNAHQGVNGRTRRPGLVRRCWAITQVGRSRCVSIRFDSFRFVLARRDSSSIGGGGRRRNESGPVLIGTVHGLLGLGGPDCLRTAKDVATSGRACEPTNEAAGGYVFSLCVRPGHPGSREGRPGR